MGTNLGQSLKRWLESWCEPAPTSDQSPESLGAEQDAAGTPVDDSPARVYLLIRLFRKAVVLVLGLTVVIIGIIMIVTPGPAVVVIPLGLGILATEFLWARKLLALLRQKLLKSYERLGRGRSPASTSESPGSPPQP